MTLSERHALGQIVRMLERDRALAGGGAVVARRGELGVLELSYCCG
jgi:hypothetical protein